MKPRFPSICSWCSYGCTLPKDNSAGAITWCSNDHFDNKGENNWPNKSECDDLEIEKGVTQLEINYWRYAWKVVALNNTLINHSIKMLNEIK
jgi:hypothetical protein